MRLAAFSSLALLAGLTTPTYAFDDLLKAVGLMPGAIEQPKAFDYLAPSLGFLNGNQNTYGVIDDLPLVIALAEGQQDEVTGIDFGKATAVLSLGSAPEQTTVIFGETGFADGAHDALLARGFSDNEDGEITIYANGEDGAIDLTAANDPDPLGSGMGKAQRLAVASDYVLRTDNWPLMNQSLTVLHMKPGYTDMWADTIRGIQQVSEDGAQLELASGWTLWAFANADPMTMSPDLPKSGGKTKAEQAGSDPLGTFPVAVIGLTRGQQTAGLHIAIPFGNPDHAKQTGETIVEKLADFPVETPDASFTVVPAGDQPGSYSVLVVTMQNYESDIAELEDLYAGFIGAIYRREFTPLMTGL